MAWAASAILCLLLLGLPPPIVSEPGPDACTVADEETSELESACLLQSNPLRLAGHTAGKALADIPSKGGRPCKKNPAEKHVEIHAPSVAPRTRGVALGGVPTPAFMWNTHWQCSDNDACRDAAAAEFVSLSQANGAQISVAIELQNGLQPVDLIAAGLTASTQVDGVCSDAYGDTVALVLASGWSVLEQGGGCLSTTSDARAFAVAKVQPPAAVQDCSQLCIVAIHAPHTAIIQGKSAVASVCGDLVNSCAIALGDWNRAVAEVPSAWADLIGGTSPSIVEPEERTCCWPEDKYSGWFDHLATNVQGATFADSTVYDYPITDLNPDEEHKPVAVKITLPGEDAATMLEEAD